MLTSAMSFDCVPFSNLPFHSKLPKKKELEDYAATTEQLIARLCQWLVQPPENSAKDKHSSTASFSQIPCIIIHNIRDDLDKTDDYIKSPKYYSKSYSLNAGSSSSSSSTRTPKYGLTLQHPADHVYDSADKTAQLCKIMIKNDKNCLLFSSNSTLMATLLLTSYEHERYTHTGNNEHSKCIVQLYLHITGEHEIYCNINKVRIII